jgi:hypothetical protein
MKIPNVWCLSLSLAICSGLLLIDRFITPVSDQTSLLFLILAAMSLVVFLVRSRPKKK